jgi:hypothetical protein
MHNIRADLEKNRLYLTFSGFSTVEAATVARQEVEAAVRQLKPGFDVVTDLSEYKPAMSEITQTIQQMQVFLKQSGLRRAVRIASPNPLTNIQFARTARVAGLEAEIVSSVVEADALLDQGRT